MPGTTGSERVQTPDGEMGAHLVLPATGSGPGVLLLQEIFGVGPYIKAVADRLGELGYVVLAPDLYWRTEPGLVLDHDQAGMALAMAAGQRLDRDDAVADAVAALGHLRRLPAVAGRVGVLGFCLGGALAFQVAARGDPDAAVCYYGSGIADALDAAAEITCPVLFHFGAEDPFIPREHADRVAGLAASRADMECHIHDGAGHAFDNHESAMFHHPEAAAAAWALTRDFLDRTLGPPAPD
ncbi:MAG: carboxymethylenebutenolidase [Solirubrobacteraceae bacterium]|nr:carboxymethylenebutenolidase [Solirubrobacteraceae bacterium]